eukprot:TRINITY_DN38501_c0_g1_i1.p1 TRINITY_DN38501_c0_g1~~TRINITY_DN38501_c0_g1_i1.p1  ORF type:complete len:671 (+),score=154.91 TRINITY_DN38501_c0_g1_i1:123-2135(+)
MVAAPPAPAAASTPAPNGGTSSGGGSVRQKTINYFTANEVAKHNHPKDLWVIMNRKVYDVTRFHKFHPGGKEVLLQMGGKDATGPANAAHKTSLPSNVMKEFEIGYVRMAQDKGDVVDKNKKGFGKADMTIPVKETPPPPKETKPPLREKTISKVGKSGEFRDKKDSSQYDYGPRVLDGCPASGNETGLLRELRTVGRFKETQDEAQIEAARAKAEVDSKTKEMAELRDIANSIGKATTEFVRKTTTEKLEVADKKYQERHEQNLEKFKRRKEEEEAANAQVAAPEFTPVTPRVDKAERDAVVKAEQDLQARIDRDRREREKNVREAREKADRIWWQAQQKKREQERGEREGGEPAPEGTQNGAPQNGPAVSPEELIHMEPAYPEGFKLYDTVYYIGEAQSLPNGVALELGAKGTITGAGSDVRRVTVRFGNSRTPAVIMAKWLSLEDPSLPGSYKVGDRVFWCGGKQKFASGNSLFFAMQGAVTAKGSTDKRVMVLFDGNDSPMDIGIYQVSRNHPRIPGDYQPDDKVYYCGEAETFANGDVLEFGLEGQVQGRSTTGDASDERRVKCFFNGHKAGMAVFLTQVMKEVPVLPGGFNVGDTVYYVGKSNSNFANGDKLHVNLRGHISAYASMGDGNDDKRVKVRFEGNKAPMNVFAYEVSLRPPGISPAT